MLSAGSKATTSPELYRKKARLKGFTEGTVQSATCTSEVCKVVVKLGLDTSKMKGLQVSETETWILEKGDNGTFSRFRQVGVANSPHREGGGGRNSLYYENRL